MKNKYDFELVDNKLIKVCYIILLGLPFRVGPTRFGPDSIPGRSLYIRDRLETNPKARQEHEYLLNKLIII